MRCVQVGEYYERLLKGLEEADAVLEEAREQDCPGARWQKLVGILKVAGQAIVGKGRAYSEEYAKLASGCAG